MQKLADEYFVLGRLQLLRALSLVKISQHLLVLLLTSLALARHGLVLSPRLPLVEESRVCAIKVRLDPRVLIVYRSGEPLFQLVVYRWIKGKRADSQVFLLQRGSEFLHSGSLFRHFSPHIVVE